MQPAPPAEIRSVEQMGITTPASEIKKYMNSKKYPTVNFVYNSFGNEYDTTFDLSNDVSVLSVVSSDFKYYSLSLILGSGDVKFVTSIDDKGLIYAPLIKAGKLYFMPKFSNHGYKGLGMAIDAGKYGFWVPISDITKRSGWHDLEIGVPKAIADYHILEGTKPIIKGKLGGVAEDIVVRNGLGSLATGLTGIIAVPIAKRLIRELFGNMKPADPKRTSSAMTTTDEYRMNLK